jgi:hypothetical protein
MRKEIAYATPALWNPENRTTVENVDDVSTAYVEHAA